jgi:hypothetical protein
VKLGKSSSAGWVFYFIKKSKNYLFTINNLQCCQNSAKMKMRTQFYFKRESILIGHKCTLFALHKNLPQDSFKLSVATLANKPLLSVSAYLRVGTFLFVQKRRCFYEKTEIFCYFFACINTDM